MTTILIPLYEGVTHLDFTGPHLPRDNQRENPRQSG